MNINFIILFNEANNYSNSNINVDNRYDRANTVFLDTNFNKACLCFSKINKTIKYNFGTVEDMLEEKVNSDTK